MTLTKDGGLILGGRSNSGVSGNRTQPSQGGTDFWLVKVASETMPIVAVREAVQVEESFAFSQISDFMAYPNPAVDRITINFTLPSHQSTSLKVYDGKGKIIITLFEGEAKANKNYEVK